MIPERKVSEERTHRVGLRRVIGGVAEVAVLRLAQCRPWPVARLPSLVLVFVDGSALLRDAVIAVAPALAVREMYVSTHYCAHSNPPPKRHMARCPPSSGSTGPTA